MPSAIAPEVTSTTVVAGRVARGDLLADVRENVAADLAVVVGDDARPQLYDDVAIGCAGQEPRGELAAPSSLGEPNLRGVRWLPVAIVARTVAVSPSTFGVRRR